MFANLNKKALVLMTIVSLSLTGCTTSKSVDVAAQTPTQEAVSEETPTPTMPADCEEIFTEVSNVRTAVGDTSISPSKAATILRNAASTWDKLSSENSGSRSEWLAKMAELSLKLADLSTSDSGFRDSLVSSQLFNNMNLAVQFCS